MHEYHTSSSATCSGELYGPSLTDICTASSVLIFMSFLNALGKTNKKISGICERITPVESPNEEYDFVVVGGGAGGSVVAARLSEISDWKVLLLEAGPDEPAGAEIPSFVSSFLSTDIAWSYKTMNESNACLGTDGSCAWRTGKNLGGNTAHNGMVYMRGHPDDYDGWEAAGNEDWGWETVLEYFKKSEDNGEIERVGTEYHATGGPLSVERFPHVTPIDDPIFAASIELDYGVSEDFNGDTKSGFSRIQATQKNGVRRSSSRAFLWPARNRKNLHVSLNSTVTRVVIENETAVGVEYIKDGESRTVYVTREVILSAGAVRSPLLLLHSGIGPKEHLESVGIEVVKNLPGVGENFHDHPSIILPFYIAEPDVYDNNWDVAAEYINNQTGPLSGTGSAHVVGMLVTNETVTDRPNIELYIAAYLPTCGTGRVEALQSTGDRPLIIVLSLLQPKSRGRISLGSNDPLENPLIWTNNLGETEDMDRMIEGIEIAMKIAETEALSAYNFTLIELFFMPCSVYEFRSYDYWSCAAKLLTYPVYHHAGTCKMGPSSDSMAVVDPQLRVHGIEGLRVADASIMPKIPAGNTAGPTMMIGERAADFIKEYWLEYSTE